MSELVEKLARAINPHAFKESTAQENAGPVMQGYYAVICNKARQQARAALSELEAAGMVVVPVDYAAELAVLVESKFTEWGKADSLRDLLEDISAAMLAASPKVLP